MKGYLNLLAQLTFDHPDIKPKTLLDIIDKTVSFTKAQIDENKS